MMLLFVIAWILFKATAPWYVWSIFIVHIIGSAVASISNSDLDRLIDKLK
jgi:hypothetical protein|tara:strand:+ start:1949 stop:2098 length:150 start_codon:yes stop_codon:yes gene_type:complete